MTENTEMIFFSFIFQDQEISNEYQFILNLNPNEYNEATAEISDFLDACFLEKLYSVDFYHIPHLIEFHYNQFKGNKIDYLNHVYYLVKLNAANRLTFNLYLSKEIAIADIETRCEVVYDWIKTEKNIISFNSIANNKPEKIVKLWTGGKDSISLFRKLLLDNELIDEIGEDEFANHFTGKPSRKMINWKDEQVIFMRLFDSLAFVINSAYLKGAETLPAPAELSRHFLIKGNEKTAKQLTQNRSTSQGIPTKKEELIKKIVNEIRQELTR